MRLVQLRIFTGDVSVEGEPVFVAPDNVGMVSSVMSDPPVCEVWLKVGTPMLVISGAAEAVAALIADDGVQSLPAPKPVPEPLPTYARHRSGGVSWRA